MRSNLGPHFSRHLHHPRHVTPRAAGVSLAAAALLALTGCAGYQDMRTLVANNFQKIAIEVAPEVAAVAKVQNVTVREKEGARGFNVQGEVTHGAACRNLTLDISFLTVKGVVLRNTSVGIPDYPGKVPARFDTVVLANAQIGSSDDVIGKVLFTRLSC